MASKPHWEAQQFDFPSAVLAHILSYARSGDYLSKVAWLAGIPLDAFMLDNTGQVTDLDASLQGVQLLLCNPKQGTINVMGLGSATVPASGLKPASPVRPGSSQPHLCVRAQASLTWSLIKMLEGSKEAAGKLMEGIAAEAQQPAAVGLD
ncbi:hypothetical protein OEZ85_007552 [Tetradesmus obliquus]|uniref:Uncharacterized protein n=1 Tax=Tetradesmus obliquus TaxID=3088 RepID=A0ABY8TGR5_TETOB|nr:hypothetical protein OEZ85_007552 [Tetradesmus obliquus]